MNPFIFAKLGIESSFLQWAQLERKARPELLNADFARVTKYVAVVAHENVVALVVEGDHVAALVLRVVRKEGRQRATDLQTQPRVEVIHDDLGLVASETAAVLYLVRCLQVGQLKIHGGTFRKHADYQAVLKFLFKKKILFFWNLKLIKCKFKVFVIFDFFAYLALCGLHWWAL